MHQFPTLSKCWTWFIWESRRPTFIFVFANLDKNNLCNFTETSYQKHEANEIKPIYSNEKYNVNSQAVGWDSWVPSALKSIFWGDLIFESVAWFFVITLKFFFTLIFEIKIHEKKSLTPKKFHFRGPIFINQHILNPILHYKLIIILLIIYIEV